MAAEAGAAALGRVRGDLRPGRAARRPSHEGKAFEVEIDGRQGGREDGGEGERVAEGAVQTHGDCVDGRPRRG